ncbi:amidase [Physcia stellaris]|nr:amidase [Physcia stellaris]
MASTPASRLLSKERLTGWVPHFPDLFEHSPSFNTLTATVQSLQDELTAGRLQSIQLVEEYQRSICLYNGWLGAVYQLAPGAMERAQELDSLRQSGKTLGPFHGIPVLIKDNIATPEALGLGTTGGAIALIGSKPPAGAPIVDKLLEAGAIVLGKTTLSELAYYKDKRIRCAWSAAAGQAQSAYVRGGQDWNDGPGGHSSPLGSSSGSAIAVSAGFAPIALGTETDGSLVTPSIRASLYTVKPSIGIIDGANIIPTSLRYDTPGPMGKTPTDVAIFLNILVDHSKAKTPKGDYMSSMIGEWADISVGTLDPVKWKFPDAFCKAIPEADKQMLEHTTGAYARIKKLVKKFQENVPLRPLTDFDYEGRNATETLMVADLKDDLDNYLASLKESKVKSLQELVDWNRAHHQEALTEGMLFSKTLTSILLTKVEYPFQKFLEEGLAFPKSEEAREKPLAHAKAVAANFDDMIEKHQLDVIIAPGDCMLSTYAAAGGYPIGTLPLDYLDYNGRPVGLLVAAPRHKESTILKVMNLWETTFSPRREPTEFLNHPVNA